MYTSKSLLDSITVGKLEFDCANIVAWLNANGRKLPRDMNLPVELLDNTSGGIERMGSDSFYGAVYRLVGYPGLVLKVCFAARDGYPEFIRSVAVKRAPKWAPKIFAHGGDETNGGFWCVMPTYEAGKACYYTNKKASHEALALRECAGEWTGCYEPRRNEFVRGVARDIDKTMRAFRNAGAQIDVHGENVMLDPSTGHYVIIDPVGNWEPSSKAAYRNANS